VNLRVWQTLRITLAAICVLVCVVWCVTWAARLARPTDRLYDFAQEWTSARNWFTGQPVYWDYGQSIEAHLGVRVATCIRYNAHPPASVLLALPFGLLDYSSAYVAWTVVSLVCLAASTWMIVREPDAGFTTTAAICFLPWLVFGNALSHQLVQGQLNLVLLVLITGAWVAGRRGYSGTSGLCLGLAAAIKLFPGFLVLYYVATREWRGVLAAVAGFAAANLAALGVLGVDTFVDYGQTVMPEVGRFRDAWTNASVVGFWAKLFDGNLGAVIPVWRAPRLARTLAAVSGVVATAFAFRAVWKSRETAERDVAFAQCIVTMLLVSPITWDHYFVLLWLPIGIAWRAFRGQWMAQSAVLMCTVLLVTVGPSWIEKVAIPAGIRPGLSPASPRYVLGAISVQFYSG
jgi:hypothetical protein